MRIADIITRIESYAPPMLAEDYDNVGLLIGDKNEELTGVLATLDVDINVAEEAKILGANLIVSHHPLIFSPLKKINGDTALGRCIMYLIKNGIAVYSAHTNLDSAEGGINDLLAALLQLENTEGLTSEEINGAIGRVGTLPQPLTMDELAEKLMEIFKISHIRYTGNGSDKVLRAAICSGSGESLMQNALEAQADVYITGDVKYHGARNAAECGMNIIEISHYDSEICAPLIFSRIIGSDINTHISKSNTNIFNVKYHK